MTKRLARMAVLLLALSVAVVAYFELRPAAGSAAELVPPGRGLVVELPAGHVQRRAGHVAGVV